MANSFIGITEPAVPNKKLDSESLVVGANTVERERVQITGIAATDVVPATLADGLSVTLGLQSPQLTFASAAALAAGTSTDLDSAQITAGLTGQLVQVIMGSSVAAKWLLKTVLNGAETDKVCFFTRPGESKEWQVPSKKFIQQAQNAGAGFDGFRLAVTSLETSEAADVYASFLFDEV